MLTGLSKCALYTGYHKESEQIITLLKKNHQHDIDSLPSLSNGVASLELAMEAIQVQNNNNDREKVDAIGNGSKNGNENADEEKGEV